MRLRITVRRHSLPETSVVWNVESESSTVAQLLEKVNEVIPIESGEWGLEDYAVELRGNNGVNFECLHFQPIGKAMKEDDEVIIRPLLTQDLKIRRVSGRIQITSDGKHLVDGLPFGRPLLRIPAANRPPIPIPPRKRQRIAYNEDGDKGEDYDDEDFQAWRREHRLDSGGGALLALEENGEESVSMNGGRQLVLHADFDDDDSEDDVDFVPGEDEESNEDTDEAEVDEHEIEEQEEQDDSAINTQDAVDKVNAGEDGLNDVPDDVTRTKIRKLHSAFPTSPIAVCKFVLDGSGGNLGEAYGTMALGFKPVKPASAITETSKATLSLPKTRSKKRKLPAEAAEEPHTMKIESAETADSLLLDHYDQNGLPPGSISSGKALSIMAEAVRSPSNRLQSKAGRSNSALSNKSVRFSLDSSGFTSTPAIDRESVTDSSEENSAESGSEATSTSGNGSSDEDSSSSDDGGDIAKEENAKFSDTSSSGSDSDSGSDKGKDGAEVSDTSSSGSESDSGSDSSSDEGKNGAEISDASSSGSDSDSDSSSDDDVPEETSSKPIKGNKAQSVTLPKLASCSIVRPGSGKKATNARNVRRRHSNALNRFKEKGILPAGTTLAEFNQLSEVNNNTSPEEALTLLEALRAQTNSAEISEETSAAVERSKNFEARREALFASLEAGGIEVGPEPSNGPSKKSFRASPPSQAQESRANTKSSLPIQSTEGSQEVSNAFSTAPETQPSSNSNAASQIPTKSAESSMPASTSSIEAARQNSSESNPPTLASESAPSGATPRRTKLDLAAGRRMLFGALGIKAPKSKKDEEKIRSDLMKDVKPVLTSNTAELAPEDADEYVEDKDVEAWREKIIYRAVECCHDGIELSEPPFPFVQRWDPQQQGGWAWNGKNVSKGKKNQRDEPQYYQDEGRPSKRQRKRKGKHTYAEQEEYLEASYEPSFQEESHVESEELFQDTELPSDDIELEVNQQLLNDQNEEPSAQTSQAPEDLAPLPTDPSTLVDLQDGQAKPGMTIAFKELTMSEQTKWQPEISGYRTAVINGILEGGEIQLTLALRDRLNAEKVYDDETGERLYGKFDMPDQDEDEEEDNGIRNLMFSELVEPRIIQAVPAGLDAENSQTDEIHLPKGTRSDSQTLSHEHEDEVANAQFCHVSETPLNSYASEAKLQESISDFVPETQQPDANLTTQETDQEAANPTVKSPIQETEEQTPKQMAESEEHVPGVEKGQAEEMTEDVTAEKQASLPERELTPASGLHTSIEQISTDARLKISRIIKDAGFRSSVPSSVLKDIRPTGVESPGDAGVFEKLMKDMTEIESNRSYSPKFHGLDAGSPIKKLRTVSTSIELSSSPERPQSSWQTIDTDVTPTFPMQEEDGSSWHEPEDCSSPPLNVQLDPVANSKPSKKFNFKKLSKAQEIWEALQPNNRKTGVDSPMPSTDLSTELDGTNERDGNASIQYPKLSLHSSFTSQVSDHGRQPDINFDDSNMTNGKATVLEESASLNPPDDLMSEVELELPSLKSRSSSHRKKQLDDLSSDDESDDEGQPPRKGTISVSAKSRSQSSDILRGSPCSDDGFPPIKDIFSSQPIRQSTTKVQSKGKIPSKTAIRKKQAKDEDSELSSGDDVTLQVSQKNSRSSKRESSRSAAPQTRKSPRHSKARESKSQASQNRTSRNQSQLPSTQQSVVVDLTLISSEVEEEPEDDVFTSELEKQPKKFRKYALSADDDEAFVGEDSGWVPKRSSSQRAAESRRQTSTNFRASSQSSLNTSRRKTTARL